MPAQAGIYLRLNYKVEENLDSRLRRNDGINSKLSLVNLIFPR